MGSSTCPLFALGDALTCPLLELVSASLAFVSIGQFSVTLQAKGRIMAKRGEWDRKFGQSRAAAGRELHILSQSGLNADMAKEAQGSLHGMLLSIYFLALLCPPQGLGCWVHELQLGRTTSYLALKMLFKAFSNATFSLNFPRSQCNLTSTASAQEGNHSNSKAHEVGAQRAEWLSQ